MLTITTKGGGVMHMPIWVDKIADKGGRVVYHILLTEYTKSFEVCD